MTVSTSLDRSINVLQGFWQGDEKTVSPRALFNLFDAGQKARLFSNIAESMQGVPKEIVDRRLKLFDKVDPAYGKGVRAALKKLYGSEFGP